MILYHDHLCGEMEALLDADGAAYSACPLSTADLRCAGGYIAGY